MKSMITRSAPFALVLGALALVGCDKTAVSGNGGPSAILSVSVSDGQAISDKAAAIAELNKYCAPGAVEQFALRASGRFFFNAGYDEHPNSGVKATVTKGTDKKGKPSITIANEDMVSDGLAMFGAKDNLYYTLFEGYCRVAMASIDAETAKKVYNDPEVGQCAYPTAAVSMGGSVGGDSAGQTFNNTSGCLVVKMSNSQTQADSHVAFCGNALASFYHYAGGGAAGTASFYMEGDGTGSSGNKN